MARADDCEVDREHQHGGADSLRARHQFLGVAAIAHHVELEPRRRGCGPCNLLDRADRDCRLDERDAERAGGTGSLHLRPLGEHPAEPDRAEDHRHRKALPGHLGRLLAR